jgi:CrcB protein
VSALVIAVALLAGALGAVLRFAASTVAGRTRANLPWAVLVVNVVGSLVGGIVIGLAQSGAIGADARLVVLGGFAGGLTTFSTFSVETVQLALAGRWRTALGSVVANLLLGLAAAVLGFALAGGFG